MPGAGGSATVSALSESAHSNSWASSSTAIRLLAGRAVAALQQPSAARVDPVMSDDGGAEMKNCPGCGLNKALSQFHRNKSKPDAHASNCKTCANAGVQRKRQLKRERDGDGLPQQRHPRRHAILDVAAAVHGGSDDEFSAEARSPGGTAGGLGRSFQAGGFADPPALVGATNFGAAAAAQLGAAHLAAASSGFQLQQQPLQHMLGGMLHQGIGSAASPLHLPPGSAAHFGAHAAAGAGRQPSLQEMLAGSYAQQHAQLSAHQFPSAAAGPGPSPFVAAAAAAAAGVAVQTKQCRTCLIERPVEGNFMPALQEPDQLSATCRTCAAASNLLGYVQQEAEMAKATLQHVRAQFGDNSPATVAAFQSALVTHQRYIKAMASQQPQQVGAAAAAPNSPVAAAVAALVAQQQQQQSLAAQLAQQQQAQQQQAHSELAQLAAARVQLAQQQQAAEQQAALQQQQQQLAAAQQQRRQEQQLQRQHGHTVGRPSPQRGSLALLPRAFSLPAGPATSVALPASRLSPAMTTPNPSPAASDLHPAPQPPGQLTSQRPASAAAEGLAAWAPALQQPSTAAALQVVARGLSLSPPMSVGTPGVGPSDSTGSLAPGGTASGSVGGSAAASPTVSVAPQHSALVQPTCFACNKPAIRGFPLPMCSECQNAGPIIGSPSATGAAATGAMTEAPTAVGALANEAGKLLSLGSLQDSLKSRSFSSTSSRSTAAQQKLFLSGFASDAKLSAGLSGRLGSDTVSAARLDDKALRDALAGAGLQLGRTTPAGGALTSAKPDSQLPPLPSAPPAAGFGSHTAGTSVFEAAAAAAGGGNFGTVAAIARLPSSGLHSILQQAAARGKDGGPKQIATRRVSWGATAARSGATAGSQGAAANPASPSAGGKTSTNQERETVEPRDQA